MTYYNVILIMYNWLVFNYFKHSIEANDEVNAVGRKANPNKADQRWLMITYPISQACLETRDVTRRSR